MRELESLVEQSLVVLCSNPFVADAVGTLVGCVGSLCHGV